MATIWVARSCWQQLLRLLFHWLFLNRNGLGFTRRHFDLHSFSWVLVDKVDREIWLLFGARYDEQ